MQKARPIVFYVEDNVRSARLLTAILQDCGCDVIRPNHPVRAVGLCNNYRFDRLDYRDGQDRLAY